MSPGAGNDGASGSTQPVADPHHVELAVEALAERRDVLGALDEELLLPLAGGVIDDAPDAPRTVVAEDVAAHQRRHALAAIDVAAGDRDARLGIAGVVVAVL